MGHRALNLDWGLPPGSKLPHEGSRFAGIACDNACSPECSSTKLDDRSASVTKQKAGSS